MHRQKKDFVVDYSAQKFLYVESSVSEVGYSDTPSNAIDPSRLLAGQPAFINSSCKKIWTRNTLIIPAFNASDWGEGLEIADLRIHELLRSGFTVYFYDNKLKKLESEDGCLNVSLQRIFLRDTVSIPDISILSKEINLPVDRIRILNKEEFEEVVKGDDTDWEKFAPYATVDLIGSPISAENFERLLRQHGHKIKSLVISGCPNLIDMFPALMKQLNLCELEELELSHDMNISVDVLQTLLARSARLKKLNLPHCKSVNKINWRELYLSKLTELNLSFTGIAIDALQDILEKTEHLKKLTANDFKSSANINWRHLNLSELEELNLYQCDVALDFLQVIFAKTTHLKKLFLLGCEIDGSNFRDFSLIELEELDLTSSVITADLLQSILAKAVHLNMLCLCECRVRDCSRINWHNLNLSELEELELTDCNITSGFMRAILSAAVHLKKLMLHNRKKIDDSIFYDGNLMNLEELTAYHNAVSATALQAILVKIIHIKRLTLVYHREIDNINWRDMDLSGLDYFSLSDCDVTADTLQIIFTKAVHLKRLDLVDCNVIGGSNLRDCDLRELRKLFLWNNNIRSDFHCEILRHVSVAVQEKFNICCNMDGISTDRGMLATASQASDEQVSSVDADTHLSTSTCFVVERKFIGKHSQPHVTNIRHRSYNQLTLNPMVDSAVNPFLLQNSHSDIELQHISSGGRSEHPLYDKFKGEGAGDYFGRYQLTLNDAWQAMPSVSSNESLLVYYVSIPDAVEIKKSNVDHFHYIRLKPGSGKKTTTIETVLSCPKESSLFYNELPDKVKLIVNNCRGFRADDLECTNVGMTSQQYLDAIIKHRVGACRHRAVAFKYMMSQQCPDIPVQLILNDVHTYPEVYDKKRRMFVRCDLGGYPADIRIKNSLLPEHVHQVDNVSDVDHPEQIYFATISRHGRHVPADYYRRACNLVTLTLDNIVIFPFDSFQHLDTLTIINSSITASALNEFLKKTPKLKTLSIKHCQMTPDEFRRINLSVLNELEHVMFEGDFIPDMLLLQQAMQTTVRQPKWVIEADHLKTSTRKPPGHRYFPKTIKTSLASIVNASWHKGLIKSQDTQALRVALQQQCNSTSKPCYYIHRPDELAMSAYYIERDGITGRTKKGPGGALYDFIHQHPDAVLIVNYDLFSPADIARFNSMLDDERRVDGVSLPSHLKIIGLINPDNPGTYQGADFYSRFDTREVMDENLSTASMDVAFADHMSVSSPTHKVIELNGGGDWVARLIGAWQLNKQQLSFQPGELVTALQQGITAITFNNPPANDPDFKRFLADLIIHQGVYHRGRLEAALPADFQLHVSQFISFPDKETYLRVNTSTRLMPACHVLNPQSVNACLGHYHCDEQTSGLILLPGLIQQYQGKTLPLYLTDTISPQAWLTLFECARRYHTTLSVSLAPGVTLPDELSPDDSVYCQLPAEDHTSFVVCEQPWLARYPDAAQVIDISELNSCDLLSSMTGRLNPETELFEFTENPGFLNQALAAKKTVVLKGTWPPALAQALTPLILARSADANRTGKLMLVSSQPDTFTCMSRQITTLAMHVKPEPIQLTADYKTRVATVTRALRQSPFVFLAGPTGVGKTHFMEKQWQKLHPACHYGTDQLVAWLLDKRPGLKTLFIDEANITSSQWSLFEGLFNRPPGIFYQGIYYPVTARHKVVFAGNPLSYGGERQQPAFFEHHHHEVVFQPLPKAVIADSLHLDAATAEPILAVYDAILDMELDNTLTPREIIMMARLTEAALQADKTLLPVETARYFAYALSCSYVTSAHRAAFDKAFKPAQRPRLPTLSLKNMILNQTNQSAIEALWHQLTLREQRQDRSSGIPVNGGLGGLILEGEPGIGKSTLVDDVLVAKGLKEGGDFIRIPVSLNTSEKEALLLKAFHSGKIVVIDEINSSPMLERLLNALLEGHDLQGDAANLPGFMLIGTQNPITFRGRISATRPLQHRLQTICLQGDYTENEKQEIIMHLGVPYRIAKDMIAEFMLWQQHNAALCFRDLLKTAKQWVKQHPDTLPLQVDLTALPQVGQMCKIVSIANIEAHYAGLLNYSPMPLQARKNGQLSIRQLAKKQGSVQGEMLEFQRWQALVTEIGYENEAISFKDDINVFTQAIQANLQAGHLMMLAFTVNMETGHPDPDSTLREEREHAAVITGYDAYVDKVTISHWGKTYKVDLVQLYQAAHQLKEERTQEQYYRNPSFKRENKLYTHKYLQTESGGQRHSIVPASQSGFQARLLVIKKPDKDSLLTRRKALDSRSIPAVANMGLFALHNPQTTDSGLRVVQRKLQR